MSRNHLLPVLALLVCLIAVMHFAAIYFHLYWLFWWYDVALHFLGGIFVGLYALWLRFLSGYFPVAFEYSNTRILLFVVLAVLCVGIGWEVFERMLGHTWSVEGYWLDTCTDVVLDLLGGLVAFKFFMGKYLVHGQEH